MAENKGHKTNIPKMRNFISEQVIMDAKDEGGLGSSLYVKDFRHIVVAISTTGNADLKLNALGAISDEAPDFSAERTAGNFYSAVQMRDYKDNSAVDGDTGITFAGTDDFRMLEINTNGLTWLNFILDDYNAGNVTVKAVAFND